MAKSQQAIDDQKTTLLIGFDSAWTAHNSGAIVGVLRSADRKLHELGSPQTVDYLQAETTIDEWQAELAPKATRLGRVSPTKIAWMLAYACWWRCTWLSRKTA